ncbi:MAG: aspartate/glutamate racemase family protein [Peptococcaceae bacterium]|nr:aspartate/glutamate racemase family protein [Peptococcaceae bacterium]
MKKIGLIGGMSPESTGAYYQYITRRYVERFGDYGYPEIIIYSVTFQQFREWQENGNWEMAAWKMAEAADALKRAGADFGAIATNTMHYVFEQTQALTSLPLISIVDATAEAIKEASLTKAGLLGTRFTMRQNFFRDKLQQQGITTLIPEDEAVQEYIHNTIFGKLCRGIFDREDRDNFLRIIDSLKQRGAQGIICGCTEIPLLLGKGDGNTKLFDTTYIHAEKLLNEALK